MSYTYRVSTLPGEPILFAEVGPLYSLARDQVAALDEVQSLLDTAPSPLHMILDLREMKMGFDDLMHAVNRSTRGQGNLMHHPNIASIIVVTNNPVLVLAGKGLNSEIFGNLRSHVFETPEEALAYARQQVAAHS